MPINPKSALHAGLTGLGQVMLQESPVTGAFFLAGLLVSSPLMAGGAVLGIIIAMLTAHALKFPEKNISAGLFGFNAALVGIAMPFFFAPSPAVLLLLVIGSAVSAVIMDWQLKKFPLPAYTSAFVVTTWALHAVAELLHLAPGIHPAAAFSLPDTGILSGFGQVMFQQNVITGVLFFIGILYNTRLQGLMALEGSVVGMLAAAVLQCPFPLISAGIFSYNGVLCGVAMSGKTLKDSFYPIASSVLSVLILLLFQKAGFIALTAPFVLSCWFFTYLRRKTGL